MGRRGRRDGARESEVGVRVCGAPRLRGRGVRELQHHSKPSSQPRSTGARLFGLAKTGRSGLS